MIVILIYNFKGPTAKTVLSKNRVGRLTLPDFKTYHKVTCCFDIKIEQLNQTEDPEIHVYGQLFFDKSAK